MDAPESVNLRYLAVANRPPTRPVTPGFSASGWVASGHGLVFPAGCDPDAPVEHSIAFQRVQFPIQQFPGQQFPLE